MNNNRKIGSMTEWFVDAEKLQMLIYDLALQI